MMASHYLWTLLKFALRMNPLLYAVAGLSAASALLELAAMTSLLPLVSLGAGRVLTENSRYLRLAKMAGIPQDARSLLILFLVLLSLRVLAQFLGQVLISVASKRLLGQLSTRAFENLVTAVPMAEVERGTIGAYISLVGDESFRASTLVSHLSQFIGLVLLAAAYFAAIVNYSPPLALGVTIFLVLCFLSMYEAFRVSHRLGARQIQESQAAGSVFLDALNGLRAVRALSAEPYVVGSYRSLMTRYLRTLVAVDLVSFSTRTIPALLLLAMAGAVVAWPALGRGLSLDLPFVATMVVFLMRFFPVVGQALGLALRVVADTRAGRDVTHLVLNYPPPPLRDPAPDRHPVSGIEAQALSFSHHPGRLVLERVDLRLLRGRSYALVGPSGSGKSTFLDLLLGFYPVQSGALLVDGTEIGTLPLATLRRRILLVPQETAIFNDTVANNLRFGTNASQAEIEHACRVACIHDFVASLPLGYETVLNYRGTNLSGGQRQRLGIARALVRGPEVLLLDESTSALDATTRTALVDSLLTEFKDRLLLFVTHDAEVIARVDEVIDMSALHPRHRPAQQEDCAS